MSNFLYMFIYVEVSMGREVRKLGRGPWGVGVGWERRYKVERGIQKTASGQVERVGKEMKERSRQWKINQ